MARPEDEDNRSIALPGKGQRAELLSTQAFEIKVVGRADEFESAHRHLVADPADPGGRALIVQGDSGTGKTFFVRELMRQLNQERPSALSLYLDVPNDGYVSSRIMALLLKMVLIPGSTSEISPINVPEELTLQRYRVRAKKFGVGRGLLRALASAVGAFLGLGSAIGGALTKEGANLSEVDDELVAYLSWAAKRETVYIAIDNVQFLNLEDRLSFESVVQRAGGQFRLIIIDRTINGTSELDPPIRCFTESQLNLVIGSLTVAEIADLVSNAFGLKTLEAQRLARDVYTKTDGIAKDVEYCLRQWSLELGSNARAEAIEGLLSTINRLPEIHLQFLVISALLDGGVDKAIACGTVARLAASDDSGQLDDVLNELLASDYLRFDGDGSSQLRPGHERIVTAVRELADEELHEDVRRSLIVELRHALESSAGPDVESYLLHCLVGLQTASELALNLNHISQLIGSQHRQDQFSYLVALADELYEVLPLLPAHALDDLLDAFQKSSAFEKGLQVLAMLEANGAPRSPERDLFRLQYLTQAYRYDEALAQSALLEDSEWVAVHQVNLLMALDRDDEALDITNQHLRPQITEAQAVQRRNTITLFDTATALTHLDEAYGFFERQGSDFRLATVDTNRSLVYLDGQRWEEAGECLERAMGRMQLVGSREIYQAQLNVAIRFALLGDYESALRALDEAAVRVPHALLFDRVKIDINSLSIQCIAGLIDGDACVQGLSACAENIRGLQLPYLHKIITANTNAALSKPGLTPWGGTGRVDLTAEVMAGDVKWGLPMSVHWRY